MNKERWIWLINKMGIASKAGTVDPLDIICLLDLSQYTCQYFISIYIIYSNDCNISLHLQWPPKMPKSTVCPWYNFQVFDFPERFLAVQGFRSSLVVLKPSFLRCRWRHGIQKEQTPCTKPLDPCLRESYTYILYINILYIYLSLWGTVKMNIAQ